MSTQEEIKQELRQRLSALKFGLTELIKRKPIKCTIKLAGGTFDGLNSVDETDECDAQQLVDDMKHYLEEFDENLENNTDKIMEQFEMDNNGYTHSYQKHEEGNTLVQRYTKYDADLECDTAYFEDSDKKCGAIMLRNSMAMPLMCRTCLDGDNSLTIDFVSKMIVVAGGAFIRVDFEEN